MPPSLFTVGRTVVMVATVGGIVALALTGNGDYVLVPLGLGALALHLINRRRPTPQGDAYDRALRQQLWAVGLVGAAALLGAIGIAAGLITVRDRAFVLICLLVMAGCTGVLVFQGVRFFRAGGGGLDAVEVWKREGLDAVRAHHAGSQPTHDEDNGEAGNP